MSDVAEIIRQAAARYQQSPEAMLRVAQLESSLNPAAANPKSSARGLFQFISPTWKTYGNGADPLNAAANADAAARFTRDNVATFRRAFNRDPSTGEIYLMHQQGPGGALKLLQNPDVPAISLVGADAIRLNGGNDAMTARDFANLWMRKADGAAQNAPQTPQNAFSTAMPQPMAEIPLLPDQNASPLASVFARAAPQPVKRKPFNLAAVLGPETPRA
jgi:hypothetical protein